MSRSQLLTLLSVGPLVFALGLACDEPGGATGGSASAPAVTATADGRPREFGIHRPPNDLIPTSIIALLANPGRFEGHRLRFRGYMLDEALFITKEHAWSMMTEYGISLYFNDCTDRGQSSVDRQEAMALGGRYVSVRGRFSQAVRGEYGEFDMGLCDLTELEQTQMYQPEDNPPGLLPDPSVGTAPRKGPRPAGSR